EYLSDEGIAAMQVAGTVAVLLPGAFYTLRDTRPPPVDRLRAAGVPMAVATDHNPGTSPLFSLLLSMNMACTLFRLTVAEAFDGVTRHAARALGLQDSHGAIGAGRPANFVLWDVRTLDELVYACGRRPACTVVRQGRTVIDGLGVLDGRRDAR
ncbi:MAG: amidohydrolase family protein, partial [Steroidobacteraceae bacterium]|nr:amidohydrolase family protein [Steroidobacteraceae bacterium]